MIIIHQFGSRGSDKSHMNEYANEYRLYIGINYFLFVCVRVF